MKAHFRTHTSEKPFKCSECSYAASNAGNLKVHMRTHTGETPFKCSNCSYAASQAGHLKKHILAVHTFREAGKGSLQHVPVDASESVATDLTSKKRKASDSVDA